MITHINTANYTALLISRYIFSPKVVIYLLLMTLLSLQGYPMDASAQDSKSDVDISGLWFLSFQAGEDGGKDISRFYAHRGYINFKRKYGKNISARITPDITIDGAGDAKMRLKYIYMDFALPSHSFITKPKIEFGMVHRSWLDFEQSINAYRMQGTMFLERNGLFNSADWGATFMALFGGEMDKNYQNEVNKKYPGRYGSASFGIYNGGGYNDPENNTNKELEARLTIRSFPDKIPGLQISYFGLYGKGNIAEEPDWTANSAFLSYQHRRFVGSFTLYDGKGDYKGKALDANGESLNQSGYSFFGEYKIPGSGFSIVGRYDSFDIDKTADNNILVRTITGISYRFHGHMAFLEYDYAKNKNADKAKSSLMKFTIQVVF